MRNKRVLRKKPVTVSGYTTKHGTKVKKYPSHRWTNRKKVQPRRVIIPEAHEFWLAEDFKERAGHPSGKVRGGSWEDPTTGERGIAMNPAWYFNQEGEFRDKGDYLQTELHETLHQLEDEGFENMGGTEKSVDWASRQASRYIEPKPTVDDLLAGMKDVDINKAGEVVEL